MQFSCEPPGSLDGSTASMFAPCFSWPYNFSKSYENYREKPNNEKNISFETIA